MTLNELNFVTLVFLILFFIFIMNFDNNFKSLVLSEFFWINLYIFALLIAFVLDDLIIVSLIFFFLIFSAVDISIGIILIILQKKIFKNTNNFHNSNINTTFITRKNKFIFFKNIKY